MTRDPLLRLRQADPAPNVIIVDPERASALLDRAVMSGAPPRWPRRRPHVVGAAVGAVLLVGGGGAAYAVFSQPASTSLGLACAAGTAQQDFERAGGELTSFMDVRSGDPVADCAAEYERINGGVPPLVAYSTGRSHLSVVPADWPVPPHWQPLATGFRNDAARLELRQRLGDVLDGPQAQCRTADAVQDMVERDLAELGLAGWTVERLAQAERADGQDWCALAFVDDTGLPRVQVQGLPGPANGQLPADEPFRKLVHTLRSEVTGRCLMLPAAGQAVEQAVRAAGFDLRDARITSIEDPDATCTRVDVPLSGRVEVSLRGPSS